MSRYIDADKVAERLKEYIDEYSWTDKNGMHGLKWCVMMEALDVVEEAAQLPDVAPVQCGQWKETEEYDDEYGYFKMSYRCPICWSSFSAKTNYCPNCGAKMEEIK